MYPLSLSPVRNLSRSLFFVLQHPASDTASLPASFNHSLTLHPSPPTEDQGRRRRISPEDDLRHPDPRPARGPVRRRMDRGRRLCFQGASLLLLA